MDEVGRGTGTNDGLSIAWAVSEDLLHRIRCRTLFATHYHELSLLSHPRLANRSMEVLDRDGEIVFLRKLKEGPAEESYGLHVARLAGLSGTVLDRAARVLEQIRLRRAAGGEAPAGPAASPGMAGAGAAAGAAGMAAVPVPAPAEDPRTAELLAELAALDPNCITPLEALNRLTAWKRLFASPGPPEKAAAPKAPAPKKPRAAETESSWLFDE
jgi:DNA mismatch repair protein MutS